jgi:hypothetical protein
MASYPPNVTVRKEEHPEKAPYHMEATVLKYSVHSISNTVGIKRQQIETFYYSQKSTQ